MKRKLYITLVAILLIFSMSQVYGQELAAENFKISLKSRTFTPPEEIALESVVSAAEGERVHVLMQFKSIPDSAAKDALSSAGIRLLNYIPKNTWFASIPLTLSRDSLALSSTRWIGSILPEDKIAPVIREQRIGYWARSENGKVNLIIKYFTDVGAKDIKSVLESSGALILSDIPEVYSITISIPEEKISELAGIDAVRWIEPVPPPARMEADRVRAHIQVDDAQNLGLSGSGVKVGVFEDSHVRTNPPDLLGRVTIGDTDSLDYGDYDHGTMVAGIIGGDGSECLSPPHGGSDYWNEGGWCYEGYCMYDWCKDHCDFANQWRGMAPAVSIFSYNFSTGGTSAQDHDNFIADLQSAINTHLIDIANNSWGTAGCNEFAYGDYSGLSPILDGVVMGLTFGRPVTVVFSAGNERAGYWENEQNNTDCITDTSAPYANYETINHPKAAKNIIVVGAIDSYNNRMSSYSSWGPTDDGRIKPDIVASGHHNGGFGAEGVSLIDNPFGTPCGDDNQQGYRAPINPDWPYTYSWFNMTSCAAAATSGSIALLLEDYRNRYPLLGDPLPSTVKALLIHKAIDLDDNTDWYNKGPDYASGYGLLQIKDAVDLMRTGSFLEDQVDHNDWAYYSFEVPQGAGSVKVTLVWDDAPGTENADPALVNDLRLLVRDPNGTLHYPWKLDPNDPSAPASNYKTTDHTNNVEQVYVDNDVIAGTWHIEVAGDSVPESPQKFTIVANQVSPRPRLCVNPGGTGGCYDSIQAAIDAAVDWDVVRVHNGTYQENINFHSKRIMVQSENGAAETIIDGNANGSVVTFEETEYFDSVLDGFTITGGANDYGGGIRIKRSSPTIINCNISGNTATNEGGGIDIRFQGASPTITNCIIAGNTASSGGGIHIIAGFPTINNCTFSGNTASLGGGLYNYYASPTVTDCTFTGNVADGCKSAYGTQLCGGGGIFNEYSSPTIDSCIFSGNIAGNGGGISNMYSSSPTIINSIFTGNQATLSSGPARGGGGLLIDFYSEPMLINCTISGNSTALDGGGILISSYTTTIINSILWGNTADTKGQQIKLENTATLSISYSDVEGGQDPAAVSVEGGCILNWGEGNIDENPLFSDSANGDFRLTFGSLCIDAGTNDALDILQRDKDGKPRAIDGDGNDVAICDMGAYEYVPDQDGDGISDLVDTVPNGYSNDFSDIATYGTITDRGDQLLFIIDEPDPEGVRIIASSEGGPLPAEVSACGGATTLTLSARDEVVVTCSSVKIEVIGGTVEIRFVAADGTPATTRLYQGNGLIFEPTTFTVTALQTNSQDVVVLVEGDEFLLRAGESVTIDTAPPEITISVRTSSLWPPNHKMVDVGFSYEVYDDYDSDPVVSIAVTSDEPTATAPGAGGPKHAPDAEVTEDGRILLRAERSGKGDGRVYVIAVTSTDAFDNSSSSSVSVKVNRSKKKETLDSGQNYDATEIN